MVVFIVKSESKRLPGTDFEGKYLSDIRFYSCKVLNFELNSELNIQNVE